MNRDMSDLGRMTAYRPTRALSLGASLVALALSMAAAGDARAQALDIRGTTEVDPRALSTDPRFLPPDNPFQPAPRASAGGGAPALPGADASAAQPANGGAVTRRPPSRASRPVQGRIRAGAERRVRPEPRRVGAMPTGAEPAPRALGLRPTTSTRIIAAPGDGLQEYPARRLPRPEDDPWAPLGLRVGGLVVTPSLTQSLGYDTNPNRAPNAPKGSVVSRTEGEVAVRSDWLTHSFTSTLRGGYSYYPGQRDASRPEAQGASLLRLNVSRDTDIDLESRLSLDTQRPGSTNFNAATTERPNVYGYGGSAGVTQRFNRLSLNLRGSVDRTSYDNATDTLGGLIRQSYRNLVQYGVRGRIGYELTPGISPFFEVSTDKRVFDETVDSAGFRRSSTGVGARVGSSFELTRLLTGEAAVGYQQRAYDDPRLRELRGVVGEAALIWSATPLTTVTLRGATDLADTTLANVSGSVNRRVSLEVSHALRRNWTVAGIASLSRATFEGAGPTEDTYVFGIRTEYKLTRSVSVRASFTHERLKSTTPGSDYTANIALIGLKLQL